MNWQANGGAISSKQTFWLYGSAYPGRSSDLAMAHAPLGRPNVRTATTAHQDGQQHKKKTKQTGIKHNIKLGYIHAYTSTDLSLTVMEGATDIYSLDITHLVPDFTNGRDNKVTVCSLFKTIAIT